MAVTVSTGSALLAMVPGAAVGSPSAAGTLAGSDGGDFATALATLQDELAATLAGKPANVPGDAKGDPAEASKSDTDERHPSPTDSALLPIDSALLPLPPIESTIPAIESTIPNAVLTNQPHPSSPIESTIPTIESTIPPIESTIPANASAVLTAKSRVSPIESTIPTIESAIPTIESAARPVGSALPTIEGALPVAEGAVLPTSGKSAPVGTTAGATAVQAVFPPAVAATATTVATATVPSASTTDAGPLRDGPRPATSGQETSPVAAPQVAVSPAPLAAPSGPAPMIATPVPPGFAAQLARPLINIAAGPPGEHVVTIHVTPDNLGPVTVRAHIGADGVRIELFAPSDVGRAAVHAVMSDLRRDLAGTGLDASLDLSDRGAPPQDAAPYEGGGQDGARTQQHDDSRPAPRTEPEAPRPAHDAPRPSPTHVRLDVLA